MIFLITPETEPFLYLHSELVVGKAPVGVFTRRVAHRCHRTRRSSVRSKVSRVHRMKLSRKEGVRWINRWLGRVGLNFGLGLEVGSGIARA